MDPRYAASGRNTAVTVSGSVGIGRSAALKLSGLLLALGGCADVSWPFHRDTQPPTAALGASPGDAATECASIRDDIRSAEQDRRQAPTTTTYSDIVAAAQAKDDQRIDELRRRADSLDCPDETSTRAIRTAPLQPAPGGASQ
jgi:hypothetical protein